MTELRWTTAGESHGRALVAVLEGMPSGLRLGPLSADRRPVDLPMYFGTRIANRVIQPGA